MRWGFFLRGTYCTHAGDEKLVSCKKGLKQVIQRWERMHGQMMLVSIISMLYVRWRDNILRWACTWSDRINGRVTAFITIPSICITIYLVFHQLQYEYILSPPAVLIHELMRSWHQYHLQLKAYWWRSLGSSRPGSVLTRPSQLSSRKSGQG